MMCLFIDAKQAHILKALTLEDLNQASWQLNLTTLQAAGSPLQQKVILLCNKHVAPEIMYNGGEQLKTHKK